MLLKNWQELPEEIKNESVYAYYRILREKTFHLLIKRCFDILFAIILMVILFFPMLVVAVWIKLDSPGSVFFRQTRVTQYGKPFKIFKFRTMISEAENLGPQVTYKNDKRITKIGKLLRKLRIDEVPQLINILLGQLSFVGTRPEAVKYTNEYTDEMKATLLLPAGVTSLASIKFKNESDILNKFADVDDTYINFILPKKMEYNLEYIKRFNLFYDIKIMIQTVIAVIKK